jgi:hypothetical protein
VFRPQQVDIFRARKNESDYEDSIEAYKEIPVYMFVLKRKGMKEVRKKKKALRGANKSLRSHYNVRPSSLSQLDVGDDKIVYEIGIHIRCIINSCCPWLPTTKPEIP